MLKRLPGRTQRPKGVKVKHVLQISLLLGICFWLVYQVKHSHDKKKELDESGVKNVIRSESEREKEIQLLKLGRKDIPREDVREGEKPDEDDEEEVPVAEEEVPLMEGEKHKNDNRDEEQEEIESNREELEDENKIEENEEIDDTDLERHDEDFTDEEKELDGGTDEETRHHIEINNSAGDLDQDLDGGDQSDHEAREEHYKADDASSEVTHEAHDSLNKGIKLNTESSDENSGTTELHKPERGDDNESETGSVAEKVENGTMYSVPFVKNVEDSSLGSAEKQLLESTQSNDRPEVVNDPLLASTNSSDTSAAEDNNSTKEASTDSTKSSAAEDNNLTKLLSTEAINSSTETGNVTFDLPRKSDNDVSVSDLDHNAQNLTIGDTTVEQAVPQDQTNSSNINLDNDKVDQSSKESSGSSNDTESEASGNSSKPDETVQEEEASSSSKIKDNNESTEYEKSNTDGTAQHDPIDSSDTQTGHEATKEARTDLRSRGDDNDEAATE